LGASALACGQRLATGAVGAASGTGELLAALASSRSRRFLSSRSSKLYSLDLPLAGCGDNDWPPLALAPSTSLDFSWLRLLVRLLLSAFTRGVFLSGRKRDGH